MAIGNLKNFNFPHNGNSKNEIKETEEVGKTRAASMEWIKTGRKKRSPDGLSLHIIVSF